MNIDVNQPTIGGTCPLGPLNFCAFNYNTLISSVLAVVITLAIAFWIRSKLESGTPTKVQAIFEWGYDLLRGLVKENVSEDALFIIPLAMTLFLYILIANWLEFFPLGLFPNLHGANSDWNQTLAMGVIVFLVVQWYSVRVQGWYGYLRRFTKPFELPLAARIVFIPLNIVEEAVKPITLSLRLFGNIFAGGIMILLIASAGFALDKYGPIPHSAIATLLLFVWKGFDVIFIGFIQAFIFMLLTVIYFGMAREGLEHEQPHTPAMAAGRMLTQIQEGTHD
jgi:F-type H+-transporting ATPase subunit a